MPKLLPAALAVVLFISSAQATDYIAIGPGLSSCGTWTADRRTRSAWFSEIAWVLGFLSGVGYEETPRLNPLQGVDAGGVEAWLDNYCINHPLQPLVEAAKGVCPSTPPLTKLPQRHGRSVS